jgi:surfeit locus 1 family protein
MSLGRIILAVCIVGGVAVLSSLGVWQLQRLDWKLAMIERVEIGLRVEPVSIDAIQSDLLAGKDIEYRPAFVTGEFLHDFEAHYFATFGGEPGYFVYTPLQRSDGSALLVNRGFIPLDAKDGARRQAGQTEGQVRINGLARTNPPEKPNTFVPDNDPAQNIYYWKNISEMSAQGLASTNPRVLPFFLDADEASTAGPEAPTGGVTRVTFNNPHLQYAITWFGLAASLFIVGSWFFFSGRRGSARDEL